ncbi:hypothetical protein StoSoilB20_27920 [Arthrobacter sp. StoSoilB20]|nr:hypothetical protein StoSoilB20_27920 [Arthrobacter sp. StoSoilB20]
MVAAIEHRDLQPQLGSGAFCNGQAKETRADDDEISVHKLSCVLACGHRNAHVYWSRLPDMTRVPCIRGGAWWRRAAPGNGKGRLAGGQPPLGALLDPECSESDD